MASQRKRKRGSYYVYPGLTCCIDGCGDPVRYPSVMLCCNCYQSLHYHMRKGVAHVVNWIKRVEKFNGRAAALARQTPAKRKAA